MALLTKSKYIVGLQCPKYLWMAFHTPEQIPAPDRKQQHVFDEGTKVGILAQSLFPNGLDAQAGNFRAGIEKSRELLKEEKPLFEAGFVFGQLYSRADILIPAKGGWDVVEVKMSTEVKEEHIQDVAFQKYVYENAGLNVRKCFLLHINKYYKRKGEIDTKKLFVKEDITKEVDEAVKEVQPNVEEMFEIINAPSCPETALSSKCLKPYQCPVKGCWQMPDGSVFELYNARGKDFELHERGIVSLSDIPDDYRLNEKQLIQKKGEVHVNKQMISSFLSSLKHPLHYLDFETFGSAIPLYDDSKPYQQIPFQYSLHIDDGKELKHYSFLATGPEDPRKKFVESLKKNLGSSGSVIVFNKTFETKILKDLARLFPSCKGWVDSVIKRVADLMVPFKNFHYYNPAQRGSCSIKAVLPALTGKSYSELEGVSNGAEASLAFLDLAFGDLPQAEKERIRKELEEYCGLDTEGMIWIVDKLREMV